MKKFQKKNENLDKIFYITFEKECVKYLKQQKFKQIEHKLENCDNPKQYAYFYNNINFHTWINNENENKNQEKSLKNTQNQHKKVLSLQEYFEKSKENDQKIQKTQKIDPEKEQLIKNLQDLKEKFTNIDLGYCQRPFIE